MQHMSAREKEDIYRLYRIRMSNYKKDKETQLAPGKRFLDNETLEANQMCKRVYIARG